MSARESFLDAVAGEVNDAMEEWDTGSVADIRHSMATHVALRLEEVRALRAAPRTITTPEELDALPDDALVLDAYAVGCQKAMEGVWCAGAELITTELVALPATVFYEPGVGQ